MTASSAPNRSEFSEADTCREFVTPAIQAAGWGNAPFEIAEQRSFTDGRIVLAGRTALNRKNPTAKQDITHLPPEQLVESILAKERQIIEIMEPVQALLQEPL